MILLKYKTRLAQLVLFIFSFVKKKSFEKMCSISVKGRETHGWFYNSNLNIYTKANIK